MNQKNALLYVSYYYLSHYMLSFQLSITQIMAKINPIQRLDESPKREPTIKVLKVDEAFVIKPAGKWLSCRGPVL